MQFLAAALRKKTLTRLSLLFYYVHLSSRVYGIILNFDSPSCFPGLCRVVFRLRASALVFEDLKSRALLERILLLGPSTAKRPGYRGNGRR